MKGSKTHLRSNDGRALCTTRGKAIVFVEGSTSPTCRRCLVLSEQVLETRPFLAPHGGPSKRSLITHTVVLIGGKAVQVLCGFVQLANVMPVDSDKDTQAAPSCPVCAHRQAIFFRRRPVRPEAA